jgi:hypothetical protein
VTTIGRSRCNRHVSPEENRPGIRPSDSETPLPGSPCGCPIGGSGSESLIVQSPGSERLTDSDDSILFEQLDPGVTKRGVVIYDVPTDQTGRQLRVKPAGAFSGADEHFVELE